MNCGRCGNNQVGGAQTFPCKDKLDKVKRDIDALERCLIAAANPPTRPIGRRCCCCCCCCRTNGTVAGNQTSWGRCE